MSNERLIKTAEYIRHALRHVHTGMHSKWILLQDIKLPSEDLQFSICIRNVLLHPNFGIAILDLVPGPTVSDVALKICRMLDADGFAAAFGGLPPVVHLHMPTHALPDLEVALDQAFAQKPPIALQHGAAWVAAVQRRFEVLPNTPLSAGMVDGNGASIWPRKIFKRYRTARPRSRGLRGLLWFWGGMLTGGSIGVAVLQYLGPPTQPIPGMPQAWLAAEPARLLVSQQTQTPSSPVVSVLLAPMPPEAVASATLTAGAPGQDRDQPGPAAAEAIAPYDPPAPFAAAMPIPSEATAWQDIATIVPEQADPEPPVPTVNRSPDPGPPEPAMTLAPMPPEAVEAIKLKMTTSPLLVTTEALIRRADTMISRGDISAARLLYRRAAAGGSSHAMLALGKTYDTFFLAEIGARGIVGDDAVAIDWYQHAFALGVNEAGQRLTLHNILPENPTINDCKTCQGEHNIFNPRR